MPNLHLVGERLPLTIGIPLAFIAAIAMNAGWALRSQAQDTDLYYLCQRSPFNVRCNGYQSAEKRKEQSLGERQDSLTQVIKIKLNDLADVSEWVRVERTGDQVKLLHTTVAPNGVAKAISAISGIPSVFSDSDAVRAVSIIGALPPLAHTWYDHPTSRIVFLPDTCPEATAS